MPTTSFVYKVKVRLGAIQSAIIRSSAIFDDILRNLFTYKKIKFALFTTRDRLGQGRPPYLITYDVICLHSRG